MKKWNPWNPAIKPGKEFHLLRLHDPNQIQEFETAWGYCDVYEVSPNGNLDKSGQAVKIEFGSETRINLMPANDPEMTIVRTNWEYLPLDLVDPTLLENLVNALSGISTPEFNYRFYTRDTMVVVVREPIVESAEVKTADEKQTDILPHQRCSLSPTELHIKEPRTESALPVIGRTPSPKVHICQFCKGVFSTDAFVE
ncbi:MAG: hypothetical protein Athens101428_445 [Candidatus Berkelbacteria bacterium Athens1014_28]|uniref:Uncharacterized protein n=1 Tax=Candidatus Berkelbacteria bacterium Athens1014_28 TaxID=2017145 RepID=A0A554LM67_9BACT|nr:MAG: hypothetical protein Athens101428_445 [Candidatus Berkelbacteria bacterium Athens1014_28]